MAVVEYLGLHKCRLRRVRSKSPRPRQRAGWEAVEFLPAVCAPFLTTHYGQGAEAVVYMPAQLHECSRWAEHVQAGTVLDWVDDEVGVEGEKCTAALWMEGISTSAAMVPMQQQVCARLGQVGWHRLRRSR